MGILKLMPALITIACLLAGAMATDVSARIEAQWALQAGDVLVGEDINIQKVSSSLFHQQDMRATDLENFDLDWPITADGIEMGPTLGDAEVDDLVDLDGKASANIVPFGPVDLAFPVLHEDTTQTADAASTGFFTANWCYTTDTVTGNLGTEPLGIYPASGHPFKSPKMMGSEFLWPYMIPRASAADGNMMLDVGSLVTGSEVPSVGSVVPGLPSFDITGDIFKYAVSNATRPINNTTGRAGNVTTGTGNVTKPATGGNNTSATKATTEQLPAGWGQKKPKVNGKMNKSQIANSTTLQRLYRNAFGATTMHKAYEGPVYSPVWIDPYDKGKGVFNIVDARKANQLGMNKTMPGARIAPLFWDL